MTTCSACIRALQVPMHRDFRRDCPGCGVRQLALMGADERERMLDMLTHLCGPKARDRVRQEVRVEMARIRKLRGEVSRRKERA